jgi:uncharacterized protein (DUF58 family)
VTAPEAFAGLVDTAGTPDRQTFDRVREYQPGDPLRDVSWKASAKQPVPDDLVVVEFAAEDEGSVTVAVEGTDDVDRVAAAGASVCAYLLDSDLDVAMVAPDRRIEAGAGERQREAILDVLARTGGGRLAAGDAEAADVHVREDGDGVVVEVRGREILFDELVDDRAFEESADDVAGATDTDGSGERRERNGGDDAEAVPA